MRNINVTMQIPKHSQTIFFHFSKRKEQQKTKLSFCRQFNQDEYNSLASTIQKDASCLFQMKIVYNFLPRTPNVCVSDGVNLGCAWQVTRADVSIFAKTLEEFL